MAIYYKTLKVRCTLLDPMLGSIPADTEIFSTYVAANAPDAMTIQEEIENYGATQVEEKLRTVFIRDDSGCPCLMDYHIKGFFKGACGMLRRAGKSHPNESSKLKAYRKSIDGNVFVYPRKIRLTDENGNPAVVGNSQRPLRASTPQGERIALASSDSVPEGTELAFTIQILDDSLEPAVMEWLEYGVLSGFGQWRNSGAGRFVFELLS